MFFNGEPNNFDYNLHSAVMWANPFLLFLWGHRSAFEICEYIQTYMLRSSQLVRIVVNNDY